MIRSDQFDHHFVQEILAEPGGENLLTCWSCGTCAATCLVRRYEPVFNPRLILHKAGLGLRDEVLCCSEVWQCSACDACYPRCPKEIHISDVMKAIRNIAIREGYERPGPVAEVDETVCSGCAVCTRACPYEAIERVTKLVDGVERTVAHVDQNLCMHCGVCVAACPSGAMSLESFNDQELIARMGAGGWLQQAGYLAGQAEEPRILAFVCQWSLHADVEWDHLASLESDSLHVVNLPCSGRVDPSMILLALTQGADGVLVVGCKEGECHYERGTYLGRSKLALLGTIFDQMGISSVRVRFAELGALDRYVLPDLVAGLARDIAETLPRGVRHVAAAAVPQQAQ
ncbi:MAG: hydrogenase iron-sulfur subunit [Anaerolineae bacterium]|nr:hydrogenase iron-sulfur subunit [Anaerolineae bacterium]